MPVPASCPGCIHAPRHARAYIHQAVKVQARKVTGENAWRSGIDPLWRADRDIDVGHEHAMWPFISLCSLCLQQQGSSRPIRRALTLCYICCAGALRGRPAWAGAAALRCPLHSWARPAAPRLQAPLRSCAALAAGAQGGSACWRELRACPRPEQQAQGLCQRHPLPEEPPDEQVRVSAPAISDAW